MQEVGGKVAFITGGASGIGLGIAKAFADAGMRLALADIGERALGEAERFFAARGVPCRTLLLDVRDRAGWARAVAEAEAALGPIAILCNNAGVGDLAPTTAIDLAQWDWVLGVNLGGVVNGVHAILPGLLARGAGHIVNTASDAVFRAHPGSGAYCVAKAGVVQLTELLKNDLAGRGVGVTVLCPGLVRTNIVDNFLNQRPPEAPASERVRQTHARMARLVTAGLDPDIVGRKVLQAVRNDRLYLFTDSAIKRHVEARSRDLIAAVAEVDDYNSEEALAARS